MKGTKCEPGYISKQKRFQSLMLLLYIVIGVGLFGIGYLITGTRANVFTVLGMLMVLPAAKRVISLVVMVPRHSVEQGRYDEMKASLSGQAVLLTDYVFTSPDKIMSLDFVIVEKKQVMGVAGVSSKNLPYMKEYLEKSVHSVDEGFQVKIFESDEAFHKFYKRTKGNKIPLENKFSKEKAFSLGNEIPKDKTLSKENAFSLEEVVELLKILAV